MKKRFMLLALLLYALTAAACGGAAKTPFAAIEAEEIVSAELYLVPSGSTITVADDGGLAELAELLRDVRLYERNDSGRQTEGQFAGVTLTLADGSTAEIGAYGEYMFYGGICYRAELKASAALSDFCNGYYVELPNRGLPPVPEDGKTDGSGENSAVFAGGAAGSDSGSPVPDIGDSFFTAPEEFPYIISGGDSK